MPFADADRRIAELKELYPGKFLKHEEIFRNIRRGDRIFVGTGCSDPRHLVKAFMEHARAHPKAFFDAELSHLLALGLTPHSFEAFRPNFRQNFFYVADSTPMPSTAVRRTTPPSRCPRSRPHPAQAHTHRRGLHPGLAAGRERVPEPGHQRGYHEGGHQELSPGHRPGERAHAFLPWGEPHRSGRGGLFHPPRRGAPRIRHPRRG